MQHIETRHIEEQGVAQTLTQMLINVGLLNPDGTPVAVPRAAGPLPRLPRRPPSPRSFGPPAANRPVPAASSGRRGINPTFDSMDQDLLSISGTCSGPWNWPPKGKALSSPTRWSAA